jgi:hypothetical protein
VRGGEVDREPEVALQGEGSRATSNGQNGGRVRDDETQQQPTVARASGDSRSARSNDATTTTSTAPAKAAVQAPAVTVATQNERDGGGRGGESRAAPTSPPAQLVKPAVTATPVRAQRGGGDNTGQERTTAPTRGTSGGDGRGGGADDH